MAKDVDASGPGEDSAERDESVDEGMSASAQALARARATARSRGYRAGTAGRAAPSAPGLSTRRGLSASKDKSDPQAVGSEVERLIAQRGWDSQVQVGSVVGRWRTIVGDHVAAHIEPVAFEGTILTVRADSTAWATQMRLMKNSILTRIETEVGAETVTDIVVHAPGGPSWRKGPLRAPGPGPRDTYG